MTPVFAPVAMQKSHLYVHIYNSSPLIYIQQDSLSELYNLQQIAKLINLFCFILTYTDFYF